VFSGYPAYDDAAEGPRPGVLVVHEWWGHSDYEERRARMLAELGYVAFVIDMYGADRHTIDPEQAKTWMQDVTADVAAQFRTHLDQGDVDWQMVTYGGARHSFTVPDAAEHGMPALEYDPAADRRSWWAMRDFLQEVFAD
jgi:dienelactone hydrolase